MGKTTDTPMTDAEAFIFPPHITCTEQVVYAHFARDLERKLAEARKDSERLDWLEANCWRAVISVDGYYDEEIDTDRASIDAAIRNSQTEEGE